MNRDLIDFDIKEQNRLVLAIAVVATAISVFALPQHSKDIFSFAKGIVVVPAIFAFIYIVMTGSYLKYDNPKYLGDLPVSKKLRQFFYDWSIDMFWSCFFIFLTYTFGTIFGWDGRGDDSKFWLGLLVSMLVLLPVLFFSLRSWNKEHASKN